MKNTLCSLSAMMVMFFISSCMNNKPAKNYNHLIDEGSVAFIQQGLEDNQAELKASKIAQSVSKNPRVLSFSKMIILDHASAGDELEKIGINNKVRGGDSISVAHQKNINSLTSLTDKDFDKAYIQMMLNTHQSAVKSYSIASTDKIEEIQKFARKTLPTLKMHLDSANSIYVDLK
jgi:putative membrane protein